MTDLIRLSPFKSTPELQALMESEIAREAEGASDPEKLQTFLRETVDLVVLGMYGRRYQIRGMRVMRDDDFRLKPEFLDDVLHDAIRKAMRKERPDLTHLDIRLGPVSAESFAGDYCEYIPTILTREGWKPFADSVFWIRYL